MLTRIQFKMSRGLVSVVLSRWGIHREPGQPCGSGAVVAMPLQPLEGTKN